MPGHRHEQESCVALETLDEMDLGTLFVRSESQCDEECVQTFGWALQKRDAGGIGVKQQGTQFNWRGDGNSFLLGLISKSKLSERFDKVAQGEHTEE